MKSLFISHLTFIPQHKTGGHCAYFYSRWASAWVTASVLHNKFILWNMFISLWIWICFLPMKGHVGNNRGRQYLRMQSQCRDWGEKKGIRREIQESRRMHSCGKTDATLRDTEGKLATKWGRVKRKKESGKVRRRNGHSEEPGTIWEIKQVKATLKYKLMSSERIKK